MIKPNQYWFMKGKSCLTIELEFFVEVTEEGNSRIGRRHIIRFPKAFAM